MDVAFDVAGGLEHDALGADRAHDLAANDDFVSYDAAGDAGFFADDDVARMDVALDFTVDLDFAFGDEVAGDDEVGSDNRGCASATSCAHRLAQSTADNWRRNGGRRWSAHFEVRFGFLKIR